ncbi:class I SAM-dependent methyltransferase [Clostridiaceae bacterium M8S5]|nr:class I SAM-dependent methyltransferase [Clostridiaceae bacterium M8S5]
MNNMYNLGTYVAQIYDQMETGIDDVELIRKLIKNETINNILEPFCGTGRISIPLARDGYTIMGIDIADGMLQLFKDKVDDQLKDKIKLVKQDVLASKWQEGFDLVILGGNCFYELATKEEQEACIIKAYHSLKEGGFVFIDNNHMEGKLDKSWQDKGVERKSLCGITNDGAKVESTFHTIWYDVEKRLARFKRNVKVTKQNGEIIKNSFIQQKHPVSTYEVKNWLNKNGFRIIHLYGNRKGDEYTDDSPRAIFWACKR